MTDLSTIGPKEFNWRWWEFSGKVHTSLVFLSQVSVHELPEPCLGGFILVMKGT